MNTTYLSTREVAALFGVSTETVKSWRDADPATPNSPLRLIGERYKHNAYRYTHAQLWAFAERNPKYKHCVLAHAFAPLELLTDQPQPLQEAHP